MAIPLTINGAVFEYPQNFDEEWGVDATGWAQAVTAGMLSLSGGNFPLTAPVDFGISFGIKVKSVTTETVNPSTSGYLALAKTDTIGWRNNANGANLLLGIDGSNNLTFNGTPVGVTSLTDNHIFVGNASNAPADVALSGDATIVASGALTIANSAITNAKVSATAAIALTKLAAQTPSTAAEFDAGGLLVPSAVTSTQLGYLNTTTSDIQVQLDARLPLSGGTMSGNISMASNKITSLANGTASGDAVNFGQVIVFTDWASYTPLFGAGYGIVASPSFFWRQVGNTIFVKGNAQAGTVNGSVLSITLPNSTLINYSKMPGGTNSTPLGTYGIARGTPFVGLVIADGATTDKVFWTSGNVSGSPGSVYATATGIAVFDNTDFFVVDFSYAI